MKHLAQDSGTAQQSPGPLFVKVEPTFDVYKGCKEDFEKYDKQHPKVWQMYCVAVFNRINEGEERIGSKAIFELIRAKCRARMQDTFALNNTYSSDYARKFCNKYPQHRPKFEIRKKKGKD